MSFFLVTAKVFAVHESKEPYMLRKLAFIFLGLLTAFNIIAVFTNISLPSSAAVAGMNYEQLMKDGDFSRAVKAVVEKCQVNVDLGKLKC